MAMLRRNPRAGPQALSGSKFVLQASGIPRDGPISNLDDRILEAFAMQKLRKAVPATWSLLWLFVLNRHISRSHERGHAAGPHIPLPPDQVSQISIRPLENSVGPLTYP